MKNVFSSTTKRTYTWFRWFNSTKNKIEEINHNKLLQQIQNLKMALDESTIIAITDVRGTITYVNKRFCDLSKYSEEELLGQNHRILNSGYHSKEFFLDMWKTISKGNVWRGEIRNQTKLGDYYWVETTIVPVLNEKGKPNQFISIRTDITKRVEMELEKQEKMKIEFKDTMKNLQNGVFKIKKDEMGKFVYTMAEGMLMDELGASIDILKNKTPSDVFPADIASLKISQYERSFQGEPVNYEITLSGRQIYVEVLPIKNGEKVIEIVGTVLDISELRSTQKRLENHKQQYKSLYENSNDFVGTFSPNGQVLDMNQKALDLFGLSKKDIQELTMWDIIIETYSQGKTKAFNEAVNGTPQNIEIAVHNKSGEKMYFNVTLLPIVIDHILKGVHALGRDITEQKKIQERNAFLAHHDELTKLPNRRWFENELQESLDLVKETNQELAVLFIDLDRFKSINDSLGHLVGDSLLELFAKRLKKCIHQDIQFAARMGGDEFMILCPVEGAEETAKQIANNLFQQLSSPFSIGEYELFVTASVGISVYPEGGKTVVELMKNADIALYRSKEQGLNRYQVYSPSMGEKNYQSLLLERDLRKALLNDEFMIHLQPRVEAKTGKIHGAEALLRWNHPVLGLIAPGTFIPIAEEIGLIVSIGKWVKRKVCEQLLEWKKEGKSLLPISVNISAQRFLQNGFAQEVRQLLEEFQLEGKWLEIEITENSLMKNEENIFETLRELKDMGVKIFIDDFGTGYSSFNYLKEFQLDGIKIDRSFVQNISCQSDNAGIMIAMIEMAQYLNMDVIAEGVETETELEFLNRHNCKYVQGYLFDKPCSIEEFERKYLRV